MSAAGNEGKAKYLPPHKRFPTLAEPAAPPPKATASATAAEDKTTTEKVAITVTFVDSFRDGGSIEWKGEDGKNYFEDYRLGSLTPGAIYTKWPGDPTAKRIYSVSLIKPKKYAHRTGLVQTKKPLS